MLFTRPLVFEAIVPAAIARARLRTYATSRDHLDLAAFRRRQIIGWRLSEANESFLFQPEYGDSLDVDGARFYGLVEPTSAGSRIRGRIVVSQLTKVVVSLWMLGVLAATFVSLSVGMGALMCGAAVVMVRYRLSSMSRRVEARLRSNLDASAASVAA